MLWRRRCAAKARAPGAAAADPSPVMDLKRSSWRRRYVRVPSLWRVAEFGEASCRGDLRVGSALRGAKQEEVSVPAKKRNLDAAKATKNAEFYTQWADI